MLRRHNRIIKYPDFIQAPRQNYSGRKRLAPGTVVKQENGKTEITVNIKQEPEKEWTIRRGGYRMTKPTMFSNSNVCAECCVLCAGCWLLVGFLFVEWILVEGIIFRLDGNKIK